MKPLAAGRAYTVRLHFAGTKFDQPGMRKFHVTLNGKTVLKNIVVQLRKGDADNPKSSAIEILSP